MILRKTRESSGAMLENASSSIMKRLARGGHQVLADTAGSPVGAARKSRSISSAPLSLGGGQGTPPPRLDQAASQARKASRFRRLS